MAVRQLWAAALLAAAGARPAAAQAVAAPPRARPPIIRPVEAVAFAASIALAAGFDGPLRRTLQADRTAGRDDLARVGNAFGNLIYTGPLLAVGWLAGEVTHRPGLARASLRAVEAGVAAGGVTAVLKVAVGRARPNAGAGPGRFRPFGGDVSFPSGHMTVAMAVATSLARSTPDRWTDAAFYGAAALTGFARMNDDKHWLSDVVAGAAIGYLAGRQLNGRVGRFKPFAAQGGAGVSVSF